MRRFPGRFPNEIEEGLDWFRFLRAVEAEHIERVEDRREMQVKGEIKSTDLLPSEWETIIEHDELLAEYGTGSEDER